MGDFEDFIDELKRLQKSDSGKKLEYNLDGVKDFKEAFNILNYITSGKNLKVERNLSGFGSATVEGDVVIITYPAMFAMLIKHMSNFEVYPLENGRIKMGFMYFDTVKLDNKDQRIKLPELNVCRRELVEVKKRCALDNPSETTIMMECKEFETDSIDNDFCDALLDPRVESVNFYAINNSDRIGMAFKIMEA